MQRIMSYIKKSRIHFILATVCLLTALGLDMFNPRLLKTAVDEVIIGGRIDLLIHLLLALLAITLSRAFLGYGKEYLFDYGSQKVVEGLRQDLFDHLQSLSFSFFDAINTGELVSRLREDVDSIWRTVAFGLMLLVEQLLYFLVASALLFTLHPRLALLAVMLTPLIGWIALRLEKESSRVHERISDQQARLTTTAQENLAGIRLVKAFGREAYEKQKFFRENRRNYRLKIEQAGVWRRYFPPIEFLSGLVVVLVVTGGGLLVIRGEMTIGALVAFTNYIMMLVWPMRMLGWLTSILAECRAAAGKIERLFREKPAVKDPARPVIPPAFTGEVIFTGVGFENSGVVILRDINLHVRPGATVAVMGLTGAGKSSLINLLGRYYDCTVGDIYLDGVNIRDLPLALLRRQISVVMQETFLFSDTIEANVKFGAPDATPAEVAAALRAAAVDEFLEELPAGAATVTGEWGVGLSGGQKQRLAIARALLKKGKILVLDDATSNLDMETEYRIQKALAERDDITKFIIAHRISAVKNADEILIMENGRIVERGNHRQLLALKKRYYEIYCAQLPDLTVPGARSVPGGEAQCQSTITWTRNLSGK